jgi:hypothetical protein
MKGMFCEGIHMLEDDYKDRHTREALLWSQDLLLSP